MRTCHFKSLLKRIQNLSNKALLCLFLSLCFVGCQLGEEQEILPQPTIESLETLDAKGLVREREMPQAKRVSTLPRDEQSIIKFEDQSALNLIPNYNSTFVPAPGYIQYVGQKAYAQVWMSYGAGTRPIPHDIDYVDPDADPPHYHIVWDDFCITLDGKSGVGPNQPLCVPIEEAKNVDRRHLAMFGSDHLFIHTYSEGGAIQNFKFLGITVEGTHAIQIMAKGTDGIWDLWPEIKPGEWDFSNNANKLYTEMHITGVSDVWSDKYSVDDIHIEPVN